MGRHAGARNCEVCISLDYETGSLNIEVSDDGRGIEKDHKPGIGLSSMRERAEELGGFFEVSCMPAGGTRALAFEGFRQQASEKSREQGAAAAELQMSDSSESQESTPAHEIEGLKHDS